MYKRQLDGSPLGGGEWNGTGFNITADGLDVGEHTFNLTLVDYFNQTTVSIVIVTVTPDAHLPQIMYVQVMQSFWTPTENNVTVQAYATDLNGIEKIQVEWKVGEEGEANVKNMTLHIGDLYVAELGAFPVGTVLYYRIIATDNSSVKNTNMTEWQQVEIHTLTTEDTPALLWVPVLITGVLSFLVVTYLYVKTRTK